MAISGASRLGAAVAGMLAAAVVSSSLTGQNVGDRVRVTFAGTRTICEVAAVSDQGLDLLGQGCRQSFSYGQIYRLELSSGVRREWRKGLAFGAATGVVVGVVLGLMQTGGCGLLWVVSLGTTDEDCREQGRRTAVAAGVYMGLRTGGLGMAIGALIKRESWTPLPIRGRRLTFSPLLGPIGGGRQGGMMLGGRIGL